VNTYPKTDSASDHGYAFLILLLAVLVMYGDILFWSEGRILSRPGTDLSSIFVYLRDFGFNQLRQGHLPLWNPGLFSGFPLLGGMQAALLYPLNCLYLFLPLNQAMNAVIVLHIFLLGYFMYLWTSFRGLHTLACLLAALLLMFSGPSMMNVYAGQLTDICTMAWAPLLFMAVDRIFARPSPRWWLLGMFAVAMQILAGHPQYMYYTALTVLIYTGLRFGEAKYPWSYLLIIAGLYAGGAALGAVQLLAGMEAASEGVRSAGVSYRFAAQFSFPLENLLTLIAPFFFGDMASVPYWGKAYLWAMTFFIGCTGLALALYGAVYGDKAGRRWSVAMILILLVLALGAYTPLFDLLYNFLPGFNKFRGASKFIFPATLFLAMLAGCGLDALIRQKQPVLPAAVLSGLVGVLLGGLAFLLYSAASAPVPAAWWRQLMELISSSGSYFNFSLHDEAAFIRKAGTFSALSLAVAAALYLTLAGFFFILKYFRKGYYFVVLLALCEIFAFAGLLRVDFALKDVLFPELASFFKEHPGDYRVLNLLQPNSALSLGVQDISGYDPGVTLRYARFLAFTQGLPDEATTNYLPIKRYHKLFRLLRLRYIITGDPKNVQVLEYQDFLPRMQFVDNFKVLPPGPAIFREMEQDSFDPRKTVILEERPSLEPVASEKKGTWQITAAATDALTIRASTPHNALLLLTDTYSRGWRARSLSSGPQAHYDIMPADYTLMAIPLAAGNHHFTIEYDPLGYRLGKWISLLAAPLFLILLFCPRKRRYLKISGAPR